MSTKISAICWDLEIESTQKFVLISLADQANDEGYCWPSVKSIERRTRLSDRSIQRSLKSLEDQFLIKRYYREGRSTYYQVTPNAGANDGLTPDTLSPPTGADPRHTVGGGVTHCRGRGDTVSGRTVSEPSSEPKKERSLATVLPDDFALTDERTAQARTAADKCGKQGLNIEVEFDKFTDYWKSKGGKEGRKTDWDATWRNWIRNARVNGFSPSQEDRATKTKSGELSI